MSLDKDFYDYGAQPPHPGEVLREDVLPDLGLTRNDLAHHAGVPVRLLADILGERKPVTLDVARRLGAALGTGAHYWLGLQMQHDLWAARHGEPMNIVPIMQVRRSPRASARLPLA